MCTGSFRPDVWGILQAPMTHARGVQNFNIIIFASVVIIPSRYESNYTVMSLCLLIHVFFYNNDDYFNFVYLQSSSSTLNQFSLSCSVCIFKFGLN